MNDEITKQVLAANLQRILHEKNWSVRKLARECGDPINTIARVVRGENLPKAGLIVRIADALGGSIDELFDARKKSSLSA